MTLDLSAGEMDDLRKALDRHLNELMEELVHTSDREYKAELRAYYDRLEAIARRLGMERKRQSEAGTPRQGMAAR
jgi:hypothetical protein